MKTLGWLGLSVALLAGSGPLWAQAAPSAAPGCTTEIFQASHLDGRTVKFNLILPAGYAASDARYPVLYLLHGYTGHYSDWCTKTQIVSDARPYPEIIVMPEGENSWYVNNYAHPKMKWEDYIVDDLIPYVDAHYRTVDSRQGRAIAGLSMGGYGALFLGLKHHGMFAAVASLSGVVASANVQRWDKTNAKRLREKTKGMQRLRRTIADDFGPANNPARQGEDPFLLIRKLTPQDCPQLYLSIGWGDSLLGQNREFVALLSRLKMPYRYSEVPGRHEWAVWRKQIRYVLAFEAPRVGARAAKTNP